jgi:formate hydrogenlyase subunit 3/multisubunit Na+/H+ antiporter MnhD subunit
MARKHPVAGMGIIFSQFSLAGFPLLAGFPFLLSLWIRFFSEDHTLTVWAFLGSVGLIVSGLRSLAVLVMGPEDQPDQNKTPLFANILIGIGVMGLFAIGLFPHWFTQIFLEIVTNTDIPIQ